MSTNWKSGLGLLAIGLIVGLVLTFSSERLSAQKDAPKGSYSVVNTDGAHLIVVDNGANKLYFYTIDKDGKIGDDLKLRGTVNLQDVGKPSIKPIDAKPQAK
jgi:hypothetical protein